VAAETQRCARVAPVFAGRFALLRCRSAMQVHPLVAVRWMRRLQGFIVIAANDGYLPDRVNFAMRTTADVNLVELLRGLSLGDVDGEYGFGHPSASGGSLAVPNFNRLLETLGFPRTLRASA
jgi:single-stranded-DNA-specific exonuclease